MDSKTANIDPHPAKQLCTRALGPLRVTAVSFGCMNLSHVYGGRPDRESARVVLHKALDAGYTMLDTATLYAAGDNEALIGETLKGRRGEYVLASKCGLKIIEGKRFCDSSPEGIRRACEESLKRLQTDVIDLYYLHRLDRSVPIEESIGALARLIEEGKIRGIGLSEMSAQTLRRAHAVHPIAAMQSEYSLWTRNVEIAVLDACKELGVAFVAFSPLARAYLTGKLRDIDALEAGDFRKTSPRFLGEDWQANLKLLEPMAAIASEVGCTMSQLALAWILAQGDHVIALPGTTKIDHLIENAGAADVRLDADTVRRIGEIINQNTVHGPRYTPAQQSDIDTEEFAS
jgi:aryl-alcohol dehydrogenase-like predicted oxidoreductase